MIAIRTNRDIRNGYNNAEIIDKNLIFIEL